MRAFEALPEERKKQMRENHTADAAQLLGAGFPSLHDADVMRIQTPTLLVTGERSPAILRRTITRKLAMHEENPEAFNRAVLSFLRRHEV